MQTQPSVESYQTFVTQLGTNIVHPLGAVLFLIATLWAFFAPRKYVIWSLLFIACFISPAQRFAFLTIDFDFLRAMTILIVVRIITFGEYRGTQLRYIDYAAVMLALMMVATGTFRLGGGMFVHKVGHAVDSVGIYMIGRMYVRQWEDLRAVLLGAALAAVPVALFFTVEQFTQRNFFSVLGGVPEVTSIRNGNLRAQGAFTHPIIAGLFWGTFAAMFIGVVMSKRRTLQAYFVGWVGSSAALVIAFMTNSSTSIACVLVAFAGWMCFPYRMFLRTIRWVVFAGVMFIHMVHPNGVHAFAFVNFAFIAGSTGRHRYILIDGALQNMSDWMFYGSSTKAYNRAFHDVTCEYVKIATNGGLIALFLEIAVITMAFYAVGRALRAARNREETTLAYGLGVAVLTVAIGALAVTIYGQGEVPFYLTFGMAASLGQLDWLRNGRQQPVRSAPSASTPISHPVGGNPV